MSGSLEGWNRRAAGRALFEMYDAYDTDVTWTELLGVDQRMYCDQAEQIARAGFGRE